MESSANAGSPLPKDTVTLPVVTADAQSSTTFTITAVGQAAGVGNPVARLVKTGSNSVGVQVEVAKPCHEGRSCCACPTCGATTSSTSTTCVVVSVKARL